ncbi:alpha/beta-hydrolase [Ascodesmis nigricans]|uniref:Carboxylic ester hydrolase n=1 Tax=Ascodesmis nigricans TaxID=341454 RepID=A0A4S2MIG5_9PEZI|nr:alpha/beta-hydrolase [Ascodesmis nigricans]
MWSSTALVLVLASLARYGAAQDELTVNAPAGPIVGHYAKGGSITSVREFLGVPYAKPPVANLRWAPPQKADAWSQPFDAGNFSAGCWNPSGDALKNSPGMEFIPWERLRPKRESEDCLTVNVWTPSKSRIPTGGAAVMVWTYGGGFSLGASESPIYHGDNIVQNQDGVIVVSFNYRLNLFGFPAQPAFGTNVNVGLRDVRRAVEWVRDNIAAFGGNPNKITLFGESAGSAATDSYLYAYASDPIIHGAIMQSGQLAMASSGLTTTTPGESWDALATAVSCPTGSSGLSCMRSIPASTLRDTMDTLNLTFSPIADGGTIFSNTEERLSAGQFARVPVLLGSNDQEIPGDDTVSKLATRVAFTCPAKKSAGGYTKFVPTWQYRFFGDFVVYEGVEKRGPTHGSEIPQIFGTIPANAEAASVASSKYIQKAWTTFAKDPTNGLTSLGWPKFNPLRSSLILLAYRNAATASYALPSLYQSLCIL